MPLYKVIISQNDSWFSSETLPKTNAFGLQYTPQHATNNRLEHRKLFGNQDALPFSGSNSSQAKKLIWALLAWNAAGHAYPLAENA